MDNKKILIVEDDLDIAELLRVNLEDIDLSCELCHRGDEALTCILDNEYALVILDLTLPGLSGLEICTQVRESKPEQQILMLTAKSSELDQIIGLESGADDYIVKPFSIPFLQARVRTRIRRGQLENSGHSQASQQINNNLIKVGDLSLEVDKRQVNILKQPVELTALEFDLLKYFATNPEQVFSRSMLLDKVWGYNHAGYEHTVNSHINRLRNKLEKAAGAGDMIQTVWGVGYRLSVENCRLSS